MKPEIANLLGGGMQEEVSMLLEKLTIMTEFIQTNITQNKDVLQNHKDEMLKAITEKNEKEIAELK